MNTKRPLQYAGVGGTGKLWYANCPEAEKISFYDDSARK
jgi:hypothetical protein